MRGRMLADTLEHIDDVGVRIDSVQAACDDQALDDTDVFGAQLRPAEIPNFAAHGNRPQGALQVIGVDRHVRVAGK
jgi:hypothetical protein